MPTPINLIEVKTENINEHSSGAKSSGDLPYYECLTDEFLDRCAQRMTEGAKKYGKYNWVKGVHDKEYIMERLRHAQKHLRILMMSIEHDLTLVNGDDDAAACCVNIMMCMDYQRYSIGLNKDSKGL